MRNAEIKINCDAETISSHTKYTKFRKVSAFPSDGVIVEFPIGKLRLLLFSPYASLAMFVHLDRSPVIQ